MGSEKGNWSTKCLVRPLSQSPPLHEDAFLVQRKNEFFSAKCVGRFLVIDSKVHLFAFNWEILQ